MKNALSALALGMVVLMVGGMSVCEASSPSNNTTQQANRQNVGSLMLTPTPANKLPNQVMPDPADFNASGSSVVVSFNGKPADQAALSQIVNTKRTP